jgi:hypothetical protein
MVALCAYRRCRLYSFTSLVVLAIPRGFACCSVGSNSWGCVDMGVTLNKGSGLAEVVVKCVVGAVEVRATQPQRSGAASQEC